MTKDEGRRTEDEGRFQFVLRLSSFVSSIIPCVSPKQKCPILPGTGGAMPKSPILARLVKTDRRKEWVALKARHKAAIAAKKLDFNAKLGPALDKYQLAVAAVTKFFVAEKLNQPAVQKVLYAARA